MVAAGDGPSFVIETRKPLALARLWLLHTGVCYRSLSTFSRLRCVCP